MPDPTVGPIHVSISGETDVGAAKGAAPSVDGGVSGSPPERLPEDCELAPPGRLRGWGGGRWNDGASTQGCGSLRFEMRAFSCAFPRECQPRFIAVGTCGAESSSRIRLRGGSVRKMTNFDEDTQECGVQRADRALEFQKPFEQAPHSRARSAGVFSERQRFGVHCHPSATVAQGKQRTDSVHRTGPPFGRRASRRVSTDACDTRTRWSPATSVLLPSGMKKVAGTDHPTPKN